MWEDNISPALQNNIKQSRPTYFILLCLEERISLLQFFLLCFFLWFRLRSQLSCSCGNRLEIWSRFGFGWGGNRLWRRWARFWRRRFWLWFLWYTTSTSDGNSQKKRVILLVKIGVNNLKQTSVKASINYSLQKGCSANGMHGKNQLTSGLTIILVYTKLLSTSAIIITRLLFF